MRTTTTAMKNSVSNTFTASLSLLALWTATSVRAFTAPRCHVTTARSSLSMAGGEGGESEWMKALMEASGKDADSFDKELKMKGLMKSSSGKTDPKLSANYDLIQWLEDEGDVYMSPESTWGEAPHPMAISVETRDEITNEISGRGLLARRDINDGDELLKIPMKLCLTKKSARKALGKDALPSSINEYLAIACQLIHERYVMGDRSFWKAYIGILPETDEVNPTFTWSDEDLSFLEGSPVVAATESLRSKIRQEYEEMFLGENGLIKRFPDRFPEDAFSFKNWEWAFVMLFSRAIRLRGLEQGETLAMVPYADLINHSPFSLAYVDARASGDWLFKDGEEEVILYADRGYRKMEQIYISYGPKSNGDLLLLYGFAAERNPFNSVDVTVAIAPRTKSFVKEIKESEDTIDPLAEQKVEFLQGAGRNEVVDFPCYADRYPVEMLEYLRLMQMTEDDTRGQRLEDFDYTRSISTANEAAVFTSVIEAIKRQLGKYPNDDAGDAAIIKDKKMFRLLSYNQRMAVRHRRNEKRLLKRTIAALEQDLRRQGLDSEDLARAEGSTLGIVLPGDEKRYGVKQRTALEQRLEKMGLPVDIR